VDEVLELLAADERMCFTLDGQLATVDDYLEIRPEAEERIRRLVGDGRLAIGPWQTLVDEFLVSGETIMRNLEVGLARAEQFGGAMRVGYLPDSFGHIAQMPQILRVSGIETAVVWRGVPSAIRSHAFTWESPDGSSVRAEYLPEGYGNAAYAFNVPEPDLTALEERLRPWFDGEPVLAMVGTDHMPPVRDLPARAPADAHIGTVAQYLANPSSLGDTSDSWRGELRSAARANLLPNVVSARMDLKAACARAERAVERYAEPLQALYGGEWPTAFLDQAWARLLQNAAHDSICGCSADEVSAQVLVRYAEAEQIGNELAQRAVERIAANAPRGSFVVVNPSPFAREDVVELDVEVPAAWEAVALETPSGERLPTQEVSRQQPLLWQVTCGAGEAVRLVRRRVHGRELFGRILNGFRVDGNTITIDVGDNADPESLDVAELLRELELATADGDWVLRIEARPRRVVAASVPAPPLGFTTVRPIEAARAPAGEPLTRGAVPPVRIVRGRDAGDSYNYAPPADDDVVDEPHEERFEPGEHGPVRRVAVLHRIYRWDGHEVATQTRYEDRPREPFVRVELSFDNPCDDQRVRVHVPLDEPVDRTFAEGQFAIVERPPATEGGYGEEPVGAYPACAYVAAGGTAFLLEHVTEYELVGSRELALTALRSTGLISRSTNRWREEPAGPELPIPHAQMHGPHRFAFGWCRDPRRAIEHAECYRLPFRTAAGRATNGTLEEHEGFVLSNATLASLRRRDGAVEARVVNETGDSVTADVSGRTVELRPWEIRSVRV
jgi:mannosylglycerate hydrolase